MELLLLILSISELNQKLFCAAGYLMVWLHLFVYHMRFCVLIPLCHRGYQEITCALLTERVEKAFVAVLLLHSAQCA